MAIPYHFLPRCMECRRDLVMRILSVHPSICQTRALWQNERKLCRILIPHVRQFTLALWQEERLVRGDPFHLKFRVNWSKIAEF